MLPQAGEIRVLGHLIDTGLVIKLVILSSLCYIDMTVLTLTLHCVDLHLYMLHCKTVWVQC